MTWLSRILFCFVLACLAATGHAEAHAALIEATPADGAIVASAPPSVRLRFNEPVTLLVARLIDAKGVTHDDLHHEARDQTITIHLPEGLPNGTQVLSYRVTSTDGHPIGGSLIFSIGAPTAATAERTTGDPGLAAAIWLSRLALYVGLFAGTGGAFFVAWIAPGATPKAAMQVLRPAIGLGLVATILSVGLQGLDALGASFPLLLSLHPWHEGIATSFGLTAVAIVGALLCAGLALSDAAASIRRVLALAGLAGAGIALALSGHASVAEPQWLTRPAVFLHGVAVAYWIGSLVPLAFVVRRQGAASLPIVRRFSAVAVPVVEVLFVSGLTLSIIQIETPSALLTTAYGRVFLAKLAAAIALLALAALNRLRLTPALARAPAASRSLIRSIMGEVALAVVILGLVAVWRFTPPPRALVAITAEPVSMHIHTAQAMAELTLNPGRAGPVQASLSLMAGDLGPLEPKEVTLTLANPSAGIEPIERQATRSGNGSWQVDNLIVPQPGRWQVQIDVLITDFDKATLEGEVEIKP